MCRIASSFRVAYLRKRGAARSLTAAAVTANLYLSWVTRFRLAHYLELVNGAVDPIDQNYRDEVQNLRFELRRLDEYIAS
jgi:hypothetical protein